MHQKLEDFDAKLDEFNAQGWVKSYSAPSFVEESANSASEASAAEIVEQAWYPPKPPRSLNNSYKTVKTLSNRKQI